MEGVSGALWTKAVDGDEVFQEMEGTAFGEEEVGLQLMTTKGSVRGKMFVEEGVELCIRRQVSACFQDMLKTGLAIDCKQQLVIGVEVNASDMQIRDPGTSRGGLNITFHMRRESAEAFNMHGTAFRQQLGHSVSHIDENPDTRTFAICITSLTYRTCQRVVIHDL